MSAFGVSYRSQEDNVFSRIVKADLHSKDHGDPDSASGRILLVEIPEDADARAAMSQSLFQHDEPAEDYMTDADVFGQMESGWYVGIMRTGGSVFFYERETEENALQEFNREVENYEPFERMGW